MSQKTIRPFHIFKRQLQVRENVVGFEKALGAVKVKFNTGLRACST